MPVSQPDITLNILPAQLTQSNAPQKVLFIGQLLPSGTAKIGELTESIENGGAEDGLFGEGSMLAGMVKAAKALNQVTRFDAIALEDDGSAVQATGTIAFSGSASVAGTYIINIGSRANHSYTIAVAQGDSATIIGDALVAAITTDTAAPFTSSNTTGTVTITSKNGGLEGNGIGLESQNDIAGVTVTVTAMSGGANNPSLTGLFDPIELIRYQTIVWPSTYTLSDVTSFLEPRWNVDNNVLDGVAITSRTETFANLKIAGTAQNQLSLVFLANRTVNEDLYKGSALFELNNNIASEFAALRSLRLTEDVSIAAITPGATFGALDSFGGTALASLPYMNTPFVNLPIIDIGQEFTQVETEELKDAGIAVLGNNSTRTSILADEIVTTYKTNSVGIVDPTFKYLNYVDTSSGVREFYFNNLKARYVQSRMTEGDLIPQRNMVNPPSMEAFLDSLYTLLSKNPYVLTQAGEQALRYFKNNRNVDFDLVAGKATIQMKMPIVTQLRTIIGTIQISFSTTS